uniref:Uncharacterized protein n=1 Tax=Glossina austeni TaxID=7395 RepID=A0A1A9UGN7_GLOAU
MRDGHHQHDLLKRYQKRIELSLEKDRQLAKKCLASGRKEPAKLLWRKKKFQETFLINTNKELENLEKLPREILNYAQVEMNIVDTLKHGNEALKAQSLKFKSMKLKELWMRRAKA